MPDPATPTPLDEFRAWARSQPWHEAVGRGVPPDAPPGTPVGLLVIYRASAPGVEALIRQREAEKPPGVPVYPVPGGRARPHDAGRPG